MSTLSVSGCWLQINSRHDRLDYLITYLFSAFLLAFNRCVGNSLARILIIGCRLNYECFSIFLAVCLSNVGANSSSCNWKLFWTHFWLLLIILLNNYNYNNNITNNYSNLDNFCNLCRNINTDDDNNNNNNNNNASSEATIFFTKLARGLHSAQTR